MRRMLLIAALVSFLLVLLGASAASAQDAEVYAVHLIFGSQLNPSLPDPLPVDFYVDGERVVDGLTAVRPSFPLEVRPGVHDFAFFLAGQDPASHPPFLEQRARILAGERYSVVMYLTDRGSAAITLLRLTPDLPAENPVSSSIRRTTSTVQVFHGAVGAPLIFNIGDGRLVPTVENGQSFKANVPGPTDLRFFPAKPGAVRPLFRHGTPLSVQVEPGKHHVLYYYGRPRGPFGFFQQVLDLE